MDENLFYRFRPLKNVLGKEHGYENGFNEIERQEIYLAASDELNDPMEGVTQYVWRGDRIVWENYLRNFLCCLINTWEMVYIGGRDFNLSLSDINVYLLPDDLNKFPKRKENYLKVSEYFFSNAFVIDFLEVIPSSKDEINIDELKSFFIIFVQIANPIIDEIVFNRTMPIPRDKTAKDLLRELEAASRELINKRPLLSIEERSSFNILNTIGLSIISQAKFMASLNEIKNEDPLDNSLKLMTDFSSIYVEASLKLTIKSWFAASASSNFYNASMWGHYAEGHTGICMILEHRTKDDTVFLPLKIKSPTRNGSSNSLEARETIFIHLHKVQYSEKLYEKDYFRSLGCYSKSDLLNGWFKNKSGEISICWNSYFENENIWRDTYWELMIKSATTKLNDWRYEDEIRLLHIPMFEEYKTKESRVARFDFADFKGIIFGIRTPEKAKVDIINIIKDKCSLEKIKDFKFYQARYCPVKSVIVKDELFQINEYIKPQI